MNDRISPSPKKLPWFMKRWFWCLLGAITFIIVFLLVEWILPTSNTKYGSWSEWTSSKDFRFHIFIRTLFGILIFGMLLYPKVKNTYLNKNKY